MIKKKRVNGRERVVNRKKEERRREMTEIERIRVKRKNEGEIEMEKEGEIKNEGKRKIRRGERERWWIQNESERGRK